ncbi:MAG TPA: FHA domain-containing protein [Terriglobales bacterium]|nr:FHA domain-containing protein [Terriglobales bacterium]
MTVECPKCGAKATFDEKRFVGKSKVQGRCPKCNQSFVVALPAAAATGTPGPPPPPGDLPKPPAGGVPAPWSMSAEDGGTRISVVRSDLHLPDGKVVSLSVIDGPFKGHLFRLSAPRVVVGRQSCDIVIDDPEISRQHCVVEVAGNRATLTDLNTTNGTFVEGQRVKSHELHHLSEFRIGTSTLMYTLTEQAKE